MSIIEKPADDCDHEDLKYGEMDVSEPGVVYEHWYCQDCGATVVNVYQPSHAVVMPQKDDQSEQYNTEAVIQ